MTCPIYTKLNAEESYANHQAEDRIIRPECNQLDIVLLNGTYNHSSYHYGQVVHRIGTLGCQMETQMIEVAQVAELNLQEYCFVEKAAQASTQYLMEQPHPHP